jgi:short chain dehydrogenase
MTISDKTALITGANRGIGQALVEEALSRGAKRVYAGTRQPLIHPDERVTPLTLDVTNAAQIQAAVESIESLDLLINNAGVALLDDLRDVAPLEQHLAVNLFGTYAVTQVHVAYPAHCQRPWPRAGAAARPKRSNAKTRRYSNQSPSRHKQNDTHDRSRADRDDQARRHVLGRRGPAVNGMDIGARAQLGSFGFLHSANAASNTRIKGEPKWQRS